ncbi:hypothetical protein B0H11DRAFT_2209095 [Mycena galericulata]|nr:hypothetical protein B0H11DRAFT_2209095 [Mycena galericulata]
MDDTSYKGIQYNRVLGGLPSCFLAWKIARSLSSSRARDAKWVCVTELVVTTGRGEGRKAAGGGGREYTRPRSGGGINPVSRARARAAARSFLARLSSCHCEPERKIPGFWGIGEDQGSRRRGREGVGWHQKFGGTATSGAIITPKAQVNPNTLGYCIIDHITGDEGLAIMHYPACRLLQYCIKEYIRAQVLTLTKGHEERIGPLKSVANSLKTYGHDDPKIVFSDDPVKDKALFYGVWRTLSQKLTPMATAHGLELLELPQNLDIKILETPARVEALCASLMASVDDDVKSHLCVSLDAEWNVSRTVGVSIVQIAPHSMPGCIYIVPGRQAALGPTKLTGLVFKTGVGVKGDLTRLKKQFPQLAEQGSFNIIDLKEYAVQRGIIGRQDSGALDVLVKKVLGKHLVKDDPIRKSEDWEGSLRPEMKTYAALDVFASRLVFEEISKIPPIDAVTIDSPVGTPVALLVQEGGAIAAYGKISAVQPPSFAGIRVHTPNRNRILVDVDSVLIPSAAAIFHQLPTSSKTKRTAAGAYTFAQLQSASSSSTFCVVASLSLLSFDRRREPTHAIQDLPANDKPDPAHVSPVMRTVVADTEDSGAQESDDDSDSESEANFDEPNDENDYPSESVKLQMLEAHADVCGGTKRVHDSESESPDSEESKFLADLCRLIEAPPDVENVYTRMKKDLFHAFRMIPMSGDHGMRAEFTRALRDHLMRWDPTARTAVDKICRTKFHRTFDEMLARSPRFIKQRVPRYNGEPLFTKEAWKKAAAVLELAREGYLSDPEGVVLYEKAGVDEDGLQKWNCKRGTNKVEGGPHSDIYRKFGALHAGARLTVNCLQDHRVFFNLQAWAKHVYGVDWEYHHNLALINRTSFLLNYLSDIIDGATSYSGWINGDLYERTEERFGICPIPDSMLSESIRIRFSMEPYSDDAARRYPLNKNDNWLRQRQGLALPTLPPTTAEARKYFFSQMRCLITQGDGKINYENFAKQWNSSADGKYRFYVTTEVLLAYAKTWDKSNNIRASRELNAKNMDLISHSRDVFAASDLPIPTFTTGTAKSVPPSKAVINLDGVVSVPDSIATSFAISHPMRVSPAGTSTERVSVGLPLNARNTVETRDLMGLRGNSSCPESSSGPTEPEERSEPPDSSWELFPGGDLDTALDKTPLADSELFSESGGFQSEFEIDNPQEQNDAPLGTSTRNSIQGSNGKRHRIVPKGERKRQKFRVLINIIELILLPNYQIWRRINWAENRWGRKFEVWIARELMDDIYVMTTEIPLVYPATEIPQPQNVKGFIRTQWTVTCRFHRILRILGVDYVMYLAFRLKQNLEDIHGK